MMFSLGFPNLQVLPSFVYSVQPTTSLQIPDSSNVIGQNKDELKEKRPVSPDSRLN